MIISKLKFTNINSGYLGTDNDFSLSVKFILSRMFFTDNEGQYLLILTTDIGYYSKLKNAKSKVPGLLIQTVSVAGRLLIMPE